MEPLLKDLPQHKERIENNTFLAQDLTEICDDFLEWSESRQQRIIEESELPRMLLLLTEKMTNFVNENYEWKGIKA